MIALEMLFFGALMVGGGLFLLYRAAVDMRRRAAIAGWTRIEGTIIGHSIDGRRKHYRPQYLVQYRVNEKALQKLCESPTRAGFSSNVSARRALERRPIGSKVLLYVHPGQPRRAYMELPEWYIVAAQATGGLLLIGAFVASVYLHVADT